MIEMETRTCLCGCGGTFRVGKNNQVNYWVDKHHQWRYERHTGQPTFCWGHQKNRDRQRRNAGRKRDLNKE